MNATQKFFTARRLRAEALLDDRATPPLACRHLLGLFRSPEATSDELQHKIKRFRRGEGAMLFCLDHPVVRCGPCMQEHATRDHADICSSCGSSPVVPVTFGCTWSDATVSDGRKRTVAARYSKTNPVVLVEIFAGAGCARCFAEMRAPVDA